MMFFISHRGNISGPEPKRENTPDYVDEAIDAGYDVEVDVWYYKNNFWLGHDNDFDVNVQVPESWFLKRQDKLWVHAKDLGCLYQMMHLEVHTFTHNRDNATITSKGHIWTYPGRPLFKYSIEVLPERSRHSWYLDLGNSAGICSDHIGIFCPTKFEHLSKRRKTTYGLTPPPAAVNPLSANVAGIHFAWPWPYTPMG